jgi:hypothetical protein
MKSLSTLLLLSVAIFFSCSNDDLDPINVPVDWKILKVENGGHVYSMYGSLQDEFIIATSNKILRTTDRGVTWTTVGSTISPVANFYTINETLFAATNEQDYKSEDNGLSWEEIDFDMEPFPTADQMRDSKGVYYHRVSHYDGELVTPSTLLRSTDRSNSWQDIFPYKKVINQMYIDERDWVYLSITGWVWEDGMFSEEPGSPGYIYYVEQD